MNGERDLIKRRKGDRILNGKSRVPSVVKTSFSNSRLGMGEGSVLKFWGRRENLV